jgi:hypothetical protein
MGHGYGNAADAGPQFPLAAVFVDDDVAGPKLARKKSRRGLFGLGLCAGRGTEPAARAIR